MKVVQAYRYALDPSAGKKRGKSKDSFKLTGAVGTVKTFESTRKLTRLLECGAARIKSATVSRVAQRWFVSLSVELDRDTPVAHPRPGSAVGIDLGVKVQITVVDQEGHVIMFAGPKPLAAGLRRLRRASRSHARKKLGSVRRRNSSARTARLHARIANQRRDAIHKATSMLSERYETVVLENLNVAGMVKNHERLSARIYRCDSCDLVIDRDVNAARNLVYLAASGVESINARGGAVRPGTARQAPVNLEPGASIEDKTGTASQRWVAAS